LLADGNRAFDIWLYVYILMNLPRTTTVQRGISRKKSEFFWIYLSLCNPAKIRA
jgi:hypothetical protein